MASQLAELSNELAALTTKVGASVVAVHGRRHTPSSGVHWRQDLIVTADHTVRRDEDITITLPDGSTAQATLAGRDPGTDLAILKTTGLTVPPIETRSTEQPRVGDMTLMLGRSPNSGINASAGIISSVSGPWRTWRGGHLDLYLRLGATIFHGSSGGAVVDYKGRVIGIATSALSRVAGLAIPGSTVDRVVDVLLEKGSMPRAYIGVGLQTIPIPESFRQKLSIKNSQGIVVLSVEAGGPADMAGILVGDILLDIEGRSTGTIDDLQEILSPEKVGKQVQANFIRGGELKRVPLLIGERVRKEPS